MGFGNGNGIGLESNEEGWKWRLGAKGVVSVKALSQRIEESRIVGAARTIKTTWNDIVPIKFNVFVWRASNWKLLVRVELDKKGIDLDSLLCPCCGINRSLLGVV